ncbi:DUF5065 family protein [Domibacillus sp. DTU_2020_1001157_1_SI_ALB_TIR_016]|uniref:DUF5065 family protein n=1 Tax=Domibacillus sp. DTU_2020_1001157_1_SI_ALB_TIR_016 TaxID=3077789 RepID=UPI0028E8D147|nr:DUF5065 family protein [Domibacillus sp. DTU_2020_1001157_1_SI_ALB_TIR_016]WNS79632.1 DUF5065 family protein [Domibacillus sp. DTU_2020_1001157_1_SI_ALB_TIR_016]
MQKAIKNKLGKLAITGALALGGLGAAETLLPKGAQHTASAATISEVQGNLSAQYASYAKNSLSVYMDVLGEKPADDNDFAKAFETKHRATFYITNSKGFAVHSGSLNKWVKIPQKKDRIRYFESLTNISTSKLPAGHYRVYVQVPLDDSPLTSFHEPMLTRHFYKDAAGKLSQFSK